MMDRDIWLCNNYTSKNENAILIALLVDGYVVIRVPSDIIQYIEWDDEEWYIKVDRTHDTVSPYNYNW
jgi:hypothetical protein